MKPENSIHCLDLDRFDGPGMRNRDRMQDTFERFLPKLQKTLQLREIWVHKSGTCAETESKPDPCGTVKDQIDPNKEPDHPAGGRPLRKNKDAQDNGYDSVHPLYRTTRRS